MKRRPRCIATGKLMHPKREQAMHAAFWTRRLDADKRRAKIYLCPHCQHWHWGHTYKRFAESGE